jgi:hypothetical protein
VTRIAASPAEIGSFLGNSYGPSWDTALAQERLVELLSDSAQVSTDVTKVSRHIVRCTDSGMPAQRAD